MIYCSCGGQKNCFRCDGKGWLDEPVADELIAIEPKLPPVLAEYSQLRESGFAKVYSGRRKSIIAQLHTGSSMPKSPTVESRKNHISSWRLAKKGKKLGTVGKLSEISIAKALTEDQRDKMTMHMQEIAKLTDILPSVGDAAEAIQRRIQEEKRAIRKLRIKAKRTIRRANAPT